MSDPNWNPEWDNQGRGPGRDPSKDRETLADPLLWVAIGGAISWSALVATIVGVVGQQLGWWQ
jgi:hypothetical protein